MQTVAPLRVGGIYLDEPAKWERVIWERVVPFLVLINIALNPFPHTTSIREFSYYSSVALLIFYFQRYRDWSALKTPFALPVALFTGWAFIGLFWALDVNSSLHDIRSHLLKYIVLFLLLTIFFNSRVKIRLLFWAIVVSVMVSGFHDMYYFYVVGKNTFLTRMCIIQQLPCGPMGLMALIALSLVVHLFRTGEGLWGKCVLAVCFGGLFLILFVTQMRSLMVALPFVILALFWDNKKLLSAVMLIMIFFILIFFTQVRPLDNGIQNADRLTINYMSLLLIKEHPIIGIGFNIDTPGNKEIIDHEALRARVPQKFKTEAVEYTNPHNIWLGMAVRLGLVGLLFFILIVIKGGMICFAGIKKNDNQELRLTGQLCLCLLVLFSIYGLFNEVFMHFLEALLCVLFAIIAWLSCETQKSNNPKIVNATS